MATDTNLEMSGMPMKDLPTTASSIEAPLLSFHCPHCKGNDCPGAAPSAVSTVDVDGVIDIENNISYIGKAQRQPDGTWIAMANVGGALCWVQCKVRMVVDRTVPV